jgi:hypothetical protein
MEAVVEYERSIGVFFVDGRSGQIEKEVIDKLKKTSLDH